MSTTVHTGLPDSGVTLRLEADGKTIGAWDMNRVTLPLYGTVIADKAIAKALSQGGYIYHHGWKKEE